VLTELTLTEELLAGVERLLPRANSGTRQDNGFELATMGGDVLFQR
jgi:hypothetical protein